MTIAPVMPPPAKLPSITPISSSSAAGRIAERRNQALKDRSAMPPPAAPVIVLARGLRSMFFRSPPAAFPPMAPATIWTIRLMIVPDMDNLPVQSTAHRKPVRCRAADENGTGRQPRFISAHCPAPHDFLDEFWTKVTGTIPSPRRYATGAQGQLRRKDWARQGPAPVSYARTTRIRPTSRRR